MAVDQIADRTVARLDELRTPKPGEADWMQEMRRGMADAFESAGINLNESGAEALARSRQNQAISGMRDLSAQYDNYIPMYEVRELPMMKGLSRAEQDKILYAMQANDTIEMSTLQDVSRYSSEQIASGIEQNIGGPWFYVTLSDDVLNAATTPSPVQGRVSSRLGNIPDPGVQVRMLDGKTGTLTGSQYGTGKAAEWEVRLEDGSMAQAQRTELFPIDVEVSRPDPASTRLWYLGTRADIDMSQYNGVYDSTMHSPLGPGTYLLSDPKMAEDAARGFVPNDAVANYPIGRQGSVSTVTANVDSVMSGDSPLMSMEEVWVGTRNLIKEFFTDPADVRNVTTAARRKNLVEFYDYLARKLNDDVRLFDFESRMSVFLHAQGIDAIVWDSPNGSVMNVIRPNSLNVGDTTKVGMDGALEQMAASTNIDGAMANIFGTQSARDIAAHSHYRFGLQMRDRLVGKLQEASKRVNQALERLDRADEALEALARTDAEVAAQRAALDIEANFNRYVDEGDLPNTKGCL